MLEYGSKKKKLFVPAFCLSASVGFFAFRRLVSFGIVSALSAFSFVGCVASAFGFAILGAVACEWLAGHVVGVAVPTDLDSYASP